MARFHLTTVLATVLAATSYATGNVTAVCCFRRGEINLAKCSHQAWWSTYSMGTESGWAEHAGISNRLGSRGNLRFRKY